MTSKPAHWSEESLRIVVTGSLLAISVALSGELDFSNAEELEMALAFVGLTHSATIRLDLAGVRFCDTSGARVLMTFVGQARDRGLRVQSYGASPALKELLGLVAGALRVRPGA